MPQTLTIRAGTAEIADGLFVVLGRFHPEMNPSDLGGYDVTVTIDQNQNQLVAILNALQDHVTQESNGPAQIEFDGHKYSLEAEHEASAVGNTRRLFRPLRAATRRR
jgi:hypothetical protein